MKFVFFDLETTGLNKDDEVIEIGAIKVVDSEVVSTFKSLVRPSKIVPRFITNLTGITQEDLNKAQDKKRVKEDFKRFIEDAVLVAHNASFDKDFLERFLEEPVQNEVIDTLELARLIYPEFNSHSLEKLVLTLNLKKEKAHRAFNDALMLYELFKKLLEESKTFSNKDMKLLQEIIGSSRNFSFLFESVGDVEKSKLLIEESNKVETLPFKNESVAEKAEVVYFEKIPFEDYIKLIKESNKVLIVTYSESLIEKIKSNLNETETFDATDLESFICIERLSYYLEHTEAIPNELRVDFAIFASYLLKTRDFTLKQAPQHVLKNKILKNLSICKSDNCNFKDVCPLVKRKKEIENKNYILMKYSNFFGSIKLLSEFRFERILFLEAYRIPKAFLSLKTNFSRHDVEMISNFNKDDNKNKLLTLFDNFENISKESKSNLIESITNYDALQISDHIVRNGFGNISLSLSNPNRLFSRALTIANSLNFMSNYFVFQSENPIEKFTGLRGKIVSNLQEEKAMTIIPLFMHAPNADEFLHEFLDLYQAFSDIKSVLFVFENRIQLNTIKIELRNKYHWIDQSLTAEDGSIDFVTYEFPVKNRFKLIFVVKLPMNALNLDENYAMYYLKNFVRDVASAERSAVLYFDGRLKDRNFVVKYEEAFLSTPMILERKENLVQFVRKHFNT